MGLMDKLKNLFTEEVEEEIEIPEEPIKKEVIQVEIPSPRASKAPVTEEILPEPDVVTEKKKDDFKFPFFDDDDFHTMETKEKPKEEKKRPLYSKKETKKEVYSPPKEDRKVFKPTPIISPVYGILDKNYQKEDIKAKSTKPRSYYNPREATVDEIRNKAYGTLEDDIETTLFGHNHVFFDEQEEDITDVLEENIKADEELIDVVSSKEDYTDSLIGERPRHGNTDEEPELTDLLQAELNKEEEKKKPHKISDSELFSMIDSMYQKGDKE